MRALRIIQGGMGAGVSSWRLARAVSRAGQLGVVSGTALDLILARRLQVGDPGGHMRRALEKFPFPGVADRILKRYFVSGGKAAGAAFRAKPVPSQFPGRHLQELLVASSFVEVFLAKEGHGGRVGINLLEKIQLPTVPVLYGAMLAGVNVVLMGAGIPRSIPGALDRLAEGAAVELPLAVGDAKGATTSFDPDEHFDRSPLARPDFLAIVASVPLATMLTRKATGKVDGFVIEGPSAGGHNAPPRGKLRLSASGEPIYDDRDEVDLEAIGALGLPFWLAGSFGRPGRLADALELGATGIQVGTAFAYTEESGIAPDIKRRVLDLARQTHTPSVRTDARASPTGFPIKVVELEGSVSESEVYEERRRICDLGYLRSAYQRPDGKLGWRCASEPVEDYVRKGGDVAETVGRKCVCNGLMETIGLGQTRSDGYQEPPMITSGDDLARIAAFLPEGATSYTAQHVLDVLLGETVVPPAQRQSAQSRPSRTTVS